jgi:hypothetical protein
MPPKASLTCRIFSMTRSGTPHTWRRQPIRGGPKPINTRHGGVELLPEQEGSPYQKAKLEAHISDKQAERWQQLAALASDGRDGFLEACRT